MCDLKESLISTLNESANNSLGRVLFHTINSNVAALTAHRGNLSAKENDKRNSDLKKKIREAGYGYIRVKGNYTENINTPDEKKVKENSLLVIGKRGDDGGKLLNDAKSWGEEYNQDSILHKKYNSDEAFLYGTSKTADWPKYGTAESVGKFHPNITGEYYSTLVSGKKFAFLSESINSEKLLFVFSDHPEYWRAKERAEQLYGGKVPTREQMNQDIV
jgi:hypothetical protein